MKAHWNTVWKEVVISHGQKDFSITAAEARRLVIEIQDALRTGGCHLKGRIKILDDENVMNLLKSGKSYKEVAEIYKCSSGAVQSAKKRYEAKLK